VPASVRPDIAAALFASANTQLERRILQQILSGGKVYPLLYAYRLKTKQRARIIICALCWRAEKRLPPNRHYLLRKFVKLRPIDLVSSALYESDTLGARYIEGPRREEIIQIYSALAEHVIPYLPKEPRKLRRMLHLRSRREAEFARFYGERSWQAAADAIHDAYRGRLKRLVRAPRRPRKIGPRTGRPAFPSGS
jgi:hypothetical protein